MINHCLFMCKDNLPFGIINKVKTSMACVNKIIFHMYCISGIQLFAVFVVSIYKAENEHTVFQTKNGKHNLKSIFG